MYLYFLDGTIRFMDLRDRNKLIRGASSRDKVPFAQGASFRNAAIVSVMVPVLRSCPREYEGKGSAAHEEEVGKL